MNKLCLWRCHEAYGIDETYIFYVIINNNFRRDPRNYVHHVSFFMKQRKLDPTNIKCFTVPEPLQEFHQYRDHLYTVDGVIVYKTVSWSHPHWDVTAWQPYMLHTRVYHLWSREPRCLYSGLESRLLSPHFGTAVTIHGASAIIRCKMWGGHVSGAGKDFVA